MVHHYLKFMYVAVQPCHLHSNTLSPPPPPPNPTKNQLCTDGDVIVLTPPTSEASLGATLAGPLLPVAATMEGVEGDMGESMARSPEDLPWTTQWNQPLLCLSFSCCLSNSTTPLFWSAYLQKSIRLADNTKISVCLHALVPLEW